MRGYYWLAVPAALSLLATPAHAIDGLYATEHQALEACGPDEVVWVDLGQDRFYHATQARYAQSSNGTFTCFGIAHANYRESHDPGRVIQETVRQTTTQYPYSGSSTTTTTTERTYRP